MSSAYMRTQPLAPIPTPAPSDATPPPTPSELKCRRRLPRPCVG